MTKEELLKSKPIEPTIETGTEFIFLNYQQNYLSTSYSSLDYKTSLDYILIVNTLERYFTNLFKWKHKDRKFMTRLEQILFKNGQVAIWKNPDNEFIPMAFSFDDNDTNVYNEPTKITLSDSKVYDGIIVSKENFVIINNNSTKTSTLIYVLDRITQIVRALVDVDNNSYLSAPMLLIGSTSSDQKHADLRNKFNEARRASGIVSVGNTIDIQSEIQTIEYQDKSKAYQDTFEFQLNTLLKFLGLKTNSMSNKAERVNQLEISRGDHFGNLLLKDMELERQDKLEELKAFGLEIDLEESDIINEEDNQEQLKGGIENVNKSNI